MMSNANRYVFSIAGVVIQLQTDQTLQMEEAFQDFLIENQQSDVNVSFFETNNLPELSGEILHQSKYYQIHIGENGEELCGFIDETRDKIPYAVRTVDEQCENIRICYLKKGTRCVSEFRNSFAHLDIETIMLRRNRLCFHASCVHTDFGGILFSGESGIGKSTQADLWCKYRNAVQINGDRPILSLDDEEKWFAWGSPYAGSSLCHVNQKSPIRAIFMLKQSDTCQVRRLSMPEAFKAVWQGITIHNWNKTFVERASELVMNLISSIPVYEYACTPDEQAVLFLEGKLREEGNNHE